jgi:hypothetical protein
VGGLKKTKGRIASSSDSLRAGRSGDRIPVGAHVQTDPEVHPASCTMGTGSFPGVKRPGRGVDHLPPSSAEVKERIQLYLYYPSGPSWPVLGWTLPLPMSVYLETETFHVEQTLQLGWLSADCEFQPASDDCPVGMKTASSGLERVELYHHSPIYAFFWLYTRKTILFLHSVYYVSSCIHS